MVVRADFGTIFRFIFASRENQALSRPHEEAGSCSPGSLPHSPGSAAPAPRTSPPPRRPSPPLAWTLWSVTLHEWQFAHCIASSQYTARMDRSTSDLKLGFPPSATAYSVSVAYDAGFGTASVAPKFASNVAGVGDGVGLGEGAGVGKAVGDAVGDDVGCGVGWNVGEALGDGVGENEVVLSCWNLTLQWDSVKAQQR